MNEVQLVRIGDVFDVETGSTPSTAIQDYWQNGRIKWITPFDLGRLGSTYIYQTSRNITQKGLENSSAKMVPAESIIISTRAPIGYLAVLSEPMAFNQGCKALLPKEPNSVSPLFMYYQLRTKVPEMNHLGSGSTFKEISKEKLESIQIQVPPLRIQKQIAIILEKADAVREKRYQAKALTEQFLQSAFRGMFGEPATMVKRWTNAPLHSITKEIYRYPAYYGIKYVAHGVPEIRGEVILDDGRIDSSEGTLRFISKETSMKFPRTRLQEGDLVMSVRGTIGKVGRVPSELSGANMTANLIRIAPNHSLVSSWFLLKLLKSEYGRMQLKKISSSTTILTLKASDLHNMPIPLPPLPAQQEFASLVEKVESLRVEQRDSENGLEHLSNSLMQRAFRGELVPFDRL